MRGKLNAVKISFEPVKDVTLGQVFGTKPLGATDMVKKLWDYIKSEGLKQAKKFVTVN